jgi:hypothetical protein
LLQLIWLWNFIMRMLLIIENVWFTRCKNSWRMPWSKCGSTIILHFASTFLYVILLLDLNSCKKYMLIMIKIPSPICSQKIYKCLFILSWTVNKNWTNSNNGMSMVCWGKPKSSQSRDSWTPNLTSGCTKQVFNIN